MPEGVWPLALSGLVPFVVALVAHLAQGENGGDAIQAFVAYAALTLAFLGGARWGAELVRSPSSPSRWRLVAAALPSVLGLVVLLDRFAPATALWLLTAGNAAQWWSDVAASRRGDLPTWNARVRTVMSALGALLTIAMLLVVATS